MNTELDAFFERIITVKWGPEKKSVDIIDQTLLPGRIERLQLDTREQIWEAIKKLRVRGAPAIGVCAAYGMAVLTAGRAGETARDLYPGFTEDREYLATSRPTAVNLFWALRRMDDTFRRHMDADAAAIKEILYDEAQAIRDEDVAISRNIGAIGFELMQQLRQEGEPLGIMTHCNAGTLATAKYGTATAPVYIALENGWKGSDMHVCCDETRPLLQGARLTSFELANAGVTTSVQCDNMASALMRTGRIKMIFVGCDRVADNGDAANKIGTSGLAIIAKHYGIPFYVCAPSSTIDRATKSGKDIPIEMRDPDEIKSMWYKEPMAPEAVDASFNPAFDVTDHELITGIITEKGLAAAPYSEAFDRLGIS